MENNQSQYSKRKEDGEKIRDFILFSEEDFKFEDLYNLINKNYGIDDRYFILEQLSNLYDSHDVFKYGDYYRSLCMNPLPPIPYKEDSQYYNECYDYDMND